MEAVLGVVGKILMASILSALKTMLRTLCRRLVFEYKIDDMKPPKGRDVIKVRGWKFVENKLSQEIGSFLEEKPLGSFVLWAPQMTGKTYTLLQTWKKWESQNKSYCGNVHGYDCVYFDCTHVMNAEDFELMWYKKMGLDYTDDKELLLRYLCDAARKFTTLVFDHFDTMNAGDFVRYLDKESEARGKFNALFIFNDYNAAKDVMQPDTLTLSAVQLFGSPGTGRWKRNDIPTTAEIPENTKNSVDLSGSLMPMINKRLPTARIQIWTDKIKNQWLQGEQALACYRDDAYAPPALMPPILLENNQILA